MPANTGPERTATLSIFESLKSELFTAFHSGVRFDFHPDTHPTLPYSFPSISHHRSQSSSSDYVSPLLDTPIDQLFTRGTAKYYFHTTSLEEWETFTLFSSQRLQQVSSGLQFSAPSSGYRPNTAINNSPDQLKGWLTNEIIPAVTDPNRPYVGFVLGDPGSGKSTIIKFSLNVHRPLFQERHIVATRFEALKYRRFASQHNPLPSDRTTLLRLYLSFILLRDLLLMLAYTRDSKGGLRRTDVGPFSTRDRISDRLERLMPAAGTADPDHLHQLAFEHLTNALHHDGLDQHLLALIPQPYIDAILRSFSSHWHYLIVFDGLDFVSIADNQFDREHYQLLHDLIAAFAGLGVASLTQSRLFPFTFNAIFILRQATYVRFRSKFESELRLATFARYQVEALDPRAAIYNAILRGHRYANSAARSQLDVSRLYKAMDIALRYVAIRFSTPKRDIILTLFNNHLRDCFQYIRRVLILILTESHIENLIPTFSLSLEESISFLASYAARKLLARKGYRLVEFLLFEKPFEFQNLLINSDGEKLTELEPGLQVNREYDGYIDNVFNYHVDLTPSHVDHHCLLEKIRILQVLSEERYVSTTYIANKLAVFFGYVTSEGLLCFILPLILVKSGFADIDISGGKAVYRRTGKGALLLRTLLRNLNYIEHVFHKTLFPASMVEDIDDLARAHAADKWALQSIRNAFVFLSYIRYVESNPAKGVEAPEAFLITPQIETSVLVSIEKMISTDFAQNRFRHQDRWLVSKALADICKITARWKTSGLLMEPALTT